MACAPSEDSDQPGYPPSLISLRCPHEESLGPELPFEYTVKTLIAGHTVILLVLSRGRSNNLYVHTYVFRTTSLSVVLDGKSSKLISKRWQKTVTNLTGRPPYDLWQPRVYSNVTCVCGECNREEKQMNYMGQEPQASDHVTVFELR